MVPTRSAHGALPDVVVRMVLVLVGVSFLASLLWCFFPNLLGLDGPPVESNARLAIPLLIALAAGLVVGYLAPDDAVRLTLVSIVPGLGLGGLLGVFAALRPHHLLIVAALVVVYGAAALAGTVIGRMPGRRLAAATRA